MKSKWKTEAEKKKICRQREGRKTEKGKSLQNKSLTRRIKGNKQGITVLEKREKERNGGMMEEEAVRWDTIDHHASFVPIDQTQTPVSKLEIGPRAAAHQTLQLLWIV